jgi:hypothetical protein
MLRKSCDFRYEFPPQIVSSICETRDISGSVFLERRQSSLALYDQATSSPEIRTLPSAHKTLCLAQLLKHTPLSARRFNCRSFPSQTPDSSLIARDTPPTPRVIQHLLTQSSSSSSNLNISSTLARRTANNARQRPVMAIQPHGMTKIGRFSASLPTALD